MVDVVCMDAVCPDESVLGSSGKTRVSVAVTHESSELQNVAHRVAVLSSSTNVPEVTEHDDVGVDVEVLELSVCVGASVVLGIDIEVEDDSASCIDAASVGIEADVVRYVEDVTVDNAVVELSAASVVEADEEIEVRSCTLAVPVPFNAAVVLLLYICRRCCHRSMPILALAAIVSSGISPALASTAVRDRAATRKWLNTVIVRYV